MSSYRRTTRGVLIGATALVGALAIMASPVAAQERSYSFEIPAQPLETALRQYSRTTSQQLIFADADIRGLRAPALNGAYSADEALQALLAGTDLKVTRTARGVVQIAADADPQGGGGAEGGAAEVEALIVTAQKKEEAIQDVPIAISAFTQKSLDAQKIEGGFDLLKAIPNVTFSKTNFTGYNFSIRGVGTKAVAASTDPGVAVSFNNIAFIHNRLFEQEYFDVERVEVLRGPQGTLYGRNATAGVINVISAKARLGEFEGDVEAEVGNYAAKRLKGMINVPLGDTVALRVAGAWTQRDGFGTNLTDGSDVDGRDLWSVRTSIGFEPNERLRANLIWERFSEDDNRVRTSKQLCHHAPADTLGNTQGCLPGSLYDAGAFGTPNGMALPFVRAANVAIAFGYNPNPFDACPNQSGRDVQLLNNCQPDPYGNRRQSTNLREIESKIQPRYIASADIFEFNLDFDVTDSITFSSQTAYNRDDIYSTQDFNRFHTLPIFNDSTSGCQNIITNISQACIPVSEQNGPPGWTVDWSALYNLTPGGFYDDPQFGPSDTIVGMDRSEADSTQFTQEFRLQSNFDAPLNFSLGANYTYFNTVNDYYVFFNLISMLAEGYFNASDQSCTGQIATVKCVYVDPNPIDQINGEGHNYFRSQNPYKLNSTAVFGELYWQATETVKVTAGLRWTSDRKVFTPHPSQTLLIDYCAVAGKPSGCAVPQTSGGGAFGNSFYGTSSRGYPAEADIVQEWREPTGRLVVDWKPELGFTNDTMLYASYAHGYKGGGANPPGIAKPSGAIPDSLVGLPLTLDVLAPATFEPEYVDAFEVGTKNTMLGGSLILNANGFFYDYTGYQVSKIVNRSAANENFDAKIWGVEVEWIYSPMRNLRFNGTFGHLDTEIAEGEQSIDLMDRTQGDPNYIVANPSFFYASNCILPVDGSIFSCPGGTFLFGEGFFFPDWSSVPNFGAGYFAELGGNELPNAPHWTASLGAQYSLDLPGGWEATGRVDGYWQSQSFHRVYNTQYDKLRGWSNVNLSLWVENTDLGVTAEVYLKNATDEIPITDAFLNSDDTALTTNVFTLDPRLVGVSIRKSF